jgi:hypothetical protein
MSLICSFFSPPEPLGKFITTWTCVERGRAAGAPCLGEQT